MANQTEQEKMLAGLPYDPRDPELTAGRLRAHRLCRELNRLDPADTERKAGIIAELTGQPVAVDITPPFFCDYGYNLVFGDNVYLNFNCVFLDVARIRIGSNVLIGPGVHVYAATHPVLAAERAAGLELGRPVAVEDDAWIGGGAILCPGTTIGKGSVIGAGSVVVSDIEPGAVAAGNPCRVIRKL